MLRLSPVGRGAVDEHHSLQCPLELAKTEVNEGELSLASL